MAESSPGRGTRGAIRLASSPMERSTASPAITGSGGGGSRSLRRSPWAHGGGGGSRNPGAVCTTPSSTVPLSGHHSSGRSVSASRSAFHGKGAGPSRSASARTPSPAVGHGQPDSRPQSPAKSDRSESSSKGRAASPTAAGTRMRMIQRGSDERTFWRPSGTCCEALSLMGPFRDTLKQVLGQPVRSGGSAGPPPRGAAAKSSRPSAREVQKLAELVTTMMACLGKLREELETPSSPCPSSPVACKKDLPLLASPPAASSYAASAELLPVVDCGASAQNVPAYPLSPAAKADLNSISSDQQATDEKEVSLPSISLSCLASQPPETAVPAWVESPNLSADARGSVSISTVASELSSVGSRVVEQILKCGTLKIDGKQSATDPGFAAEAFADKKLVSAALEGAIVQLNRRVEELEDPAAKASDLEKVVRQLRARVSELEAREARVKGLRTECGELRMRIAELVGSTVDCKSLEEDRNQLLDTIYKLESKGVDGKTNKKVELNYDCSDMAYLHAPEVTGVHK